MANSNTTKVHSIYIESNLIKFISSTIGGFFYGIGWIIGKLILLALWFTVSMIALITLGLWLSDRALENQINTQTTQVEQHTSSTCK